MRFDLSYVKKTAEEYFDLINERYVWLSESHLRKFTRKQSSIVIRMLISSGWRKLTREQTRKNCPTSFLACPTALDDEVITSKKAIKYAAQASAEIVGDQSDLFKCIFKMVGDGVRGYMWTP